jgi:hypothetical protein
MVSFLKDVDLFLDPDENVVLCIASDVKKGSGNAELCVHVKTSTKGIGPTPSFETSSNSWCSGTVSHLHSNQVSCCQRRSNA